ncbi:MAG TPA: rhodanese-like domain-containing protein [Chloroflexota bacterium]
MARPRAAVEAPRTDQETAKRLFDEGKAVFVDTRRAEAYRRSHIPGALNMSLREVLIRREEIPRDRPVIFY